MGVRLGLAHRPLPAFGHPPRRGEGQGDHPARWRRLALAPLALEESGWGEVCPLWLDKRCAARLEC
jgi:hypothetical protein